MIYHQAKSPETGLNQLWTFELADPPRILDSSDDEEDDDKCNRLRSWFGNWGGWGKSDKETVLKEKELKAAHEKVYEKKKSHLRLVFFYFYFLQPKKKNINTITLVMKLLLVPLLCKL